ncbi:carcinine hydrolase/isopenicillin-N N-acyltransferase family protein [Kiloniella laminariae]|uniref:carcinine hydrolase/isopenicillin-N N-acyltransferase family protein n=1 Tax=Kiloniella laminariae TaxID=454162 RepID=UPI000377570A|nr:hypothetical protein [Kiloniella laminariae]
MCTIGAIRFSTTEYLLFKNKDFSRSHYDDKILHDQHLWGAAGLETFSEDPSVTDIHSGLSVGANKFGLFVADAHVQNTGSENSNYDILVEVALNEGRDISSAVIAMEKYVARKPSWWGNIVLADSNGLAVAEVRHNQLRTVTGKESVIRTNHQHLHGAENGLENNQSNSLGRYLWAGQRLSAAKNLQDIKTMLASHDGTTTAGRESGICNHSYSQTINSYIIHAKAGEISLHSLVGPPCQSAGQYRSTPLFQ